MEINAEYKIPYTNNNNEYLMFCNILIPLIELIKNSEKITVCYILYNFLCSFFIMSDLLGVSKQIIKY